MSAFSSSFSSFFSNIGQKIKTVVEEEQKHVKGFLTETETIDSNKQQTPVPSEQPNEAVPPWVNLPTKDEKLIEEVKNQILNLTNSKRNFLNAPPEDAKFEFNLEEFLPIAQAALRAQSALSNARFYLVPKYIKEPQFWRNYFYRVWIIKEAYGLNPKTTTAPVSTPKDGNHSSQVETNEELTSALQDDLDVDAIKKELVQLGVTTGEGIEIDEEWEEQMKKELEEELSKS